MFDCIIEGLKNETYLEAYYPLQTDIVLDNLSLYEKEKKSYDHVFFAFGQGVKLSILEQEFLFRCLHGNFFQKDNLGVKGLSQEKILLKGLLILESLDELREHPPLVLQYQKDILSIFNELPYTSDSELSRVYLCYFKIKSLAGENPEIIETANTKLTAIPEEEVIRELKQRELRIIESAAQELDSPSSTGGCAIC